MSLFFSCFFSFLFFSSSTGNYSTFVANNSQITGNVTLFHNATLQHHGSDFVGYIHNHGYIEVRYQLNIGLFVKERDEERGGEGRRGEERGGEGRRGEERGGEGRRGEDRGGEGSRGKEN